MRNIAFQDRTHCNSDDKDFGQNFSWRVLSWKGILWEQGLPGPVGNTVAGNVKTVLESVTGKIREACREPEYQHVGLYAYSDLREESVRRVRWDSTLFIR